jgi:hypothetical protein
MQTKLYPEGSDSAADEKPKEQKKKKARVPEAAHIVYRRGKRHAYHLYAGELKAGRLPACPFSTLFVNGWLNTAGSFLSIGVRFSLNCPVLLSSVNRLVVCSNPIGGGLSSVLVVILAPASTITELFWLVSVAAGAIKPFPSL